MIEILRFDTESFSRTKSFPNAGYRSRVGLAPPNGLLDLGDLQQVALWVASAAVTGVIGSIAYDVLQAVRKRFGSDRLAELREKVLIELKRVR